MLLGDRSYIERRAHQVDYLLARLDGLTQEQVDELASKKKQ